MTEHPRDPAVEAAQRAFTSRRTRVRAEAVEDRALYRVAEDAAREALQPIRQVLDKLAEDTEPPCDYALQVELFERAINDLSPLVYTSEELSGE